MIVTMTIGAGLQILLPQQLLVSLGFLVRSLRARVSLCSSFIIYSIPQLPHDETTSLIWHVPTVPSSPCRPEGEVWGDGRLGEGDGGWGRGRRDRGERGLEMRSRLSH